MPAEDSRPNFFHILGLDPKAHWDERAYARVLDEKKREWSRQRSGIKTHPATVEAQRNLSLVRDIERVMRDAAAREAEQQAAIALAENEHRERADRVARRVDLMLAKGFLYEAEYEAVQADLAAASKAVRRRVKAAERRPDARARTDKERLDQATERNLRENLRTVGKADLYEVLREVAPHVGSESPRGDLLDAASKLYQKARHTANKDNPEVGARQVLTGIARTVFGTDENIRRYEFSMLLAPLDVMLERYRQDLAPVCAIDSSQAEMFLHEAARSGIDVALAKEVFLAYFRDLKWVVEVPGAAAEATLRTLVSCPRCTELNNPAATHCIKCGSPLISRCPRCGLELPAGAGACPQCGFHVSLHDYVEYLADEAEGLLVRGDADGAGESLRQANREWPLSPDSHDPLAIRLRQLAERLGPVQESQWHVIGQIGTLMDSRSYRAARRQLRELPFRSSAASAMLERCENAIQESGRRVREACRPGIPAERRAALYLEALEYCADNTEASRELSQLPPNPPRSLRAEPDEERRVVRLTWVPAPDEGISSVIIRGDGERPRDPASGPRRHMPRGAGTWEDRDPLVGRPMWYAVYMERDAYGTLSERGEVTSEPVFLMGAPDLTARPGDREVELTWTAPDNAVRVEIRREEIPVSATVSFPPFGMDVTRLTDGSVRNGTRYRYTARAIYVYEVSGRSVTRYSRPAERAVVPSAPPPPPGPVRVRGYPPPPHMPLYFHKARLRWAPVSQGDVRVIRSLPGGPLPTTAGGGFPQDELAQYGQVLREPEYVWLTDRERACYFTPVLVLNGRCYAGTPRPYVTGPEVRDVRAERTGALVRVSWTWPDGVDEVLVAWDEDEIDDPVLAPHRSRVRRSGDSLAGMSDVRNGPARRLFVQVAAVVQKNGADFFTSGAGTVADRHTVDLTYEIQPRRGQRIRLVLRPGRTAYLPALVLSGRSDPHPATRTDNEVLRIPPRHTAPGTAIDMRLDNTIEPRSCRLFVADETDADLVAISHPRQRL